MTAAPITDLTPKYVFLDVEVDSVPTDDGEPKECITQIAVLDPGREKGQRIFNAYIKPPEELKRKDFGRAYGEGHREPPRYTFLEVWPDLVKWINHGLDGNRNVIVITHNGIQHDWPILEREVARNMLRTAISIPRHWKIFDTLFLKNALHVPGDGSLTGLCHTLGARVREAHDAVEDVKMTKGIFKRMIGAAPLKEVLATAQLKPFEHPYIKAASIINRLATTSIAVFDFETTGLFPAKGQPGPKPRAVQLAGYIPRVNKIFNETINPGIPIPREASAVHHLYDEDVRTAPDFKTVWGRFEKFLTDNNAKTLAGHNIWFYDLDVYRAECERTGVKKQTYKSLDSLALARNLFKGLKGIPQRGFFKQEFLAALLGIDVVDAHDAKGDVMVNWQLISKLTEGVDPSKMHQAIQSPHPVVALGQLCRDEGVFKGEGYWKLYQTACGLTTDLAKFFFTEISNPDFFRSANLASYLGIRIKLDDPDLYNLWRVFLKLTEGVDRSMINKALADVKPLDAVIKLCHQKFDSKKQEMFNNKVYELTPRLVQVFFPKGSMSPEKLARSLGIVLDNAFTPFDMIRLFLEMTHGVDHITIERLQFTLVPEQALAERIREKGAFNPENYIKEEKQETKGIKREREEEKKETRGIKRVREEEKVEIEEIKAVEPKLKRLKKLADKPVEKKSKPEENVIHIKDKKLTLIFEDSSDEDTVELKR